MSLGLRLRDELKLSKGDYTPPTPAVPANTVLPAISGTPSVGSTLTTSDGTWTGYPSPTYTYQWQLGGVDIGGETGNTYTVLAGDDDGLITCEVTATNSEGSATAETVGVTATYPPANTVLPAITGTSEVGQTLTCSTGTWVGDGPITYSYQWQIDGANVGTDQNTYVPVEGDIGGAPTCEVTATGADSPPATVETAAYTVVVAASSETGLSLLQAMDLWVDGAQDFVDGAKSTVTAQSGQAITIGSDGAASDTNDPVLAVANDPAVAELGSDNYFTSDTPFINATTETVTVTAELIVGAMATNAYLADGVTTARCRIYWNETIPQIRFRGTTTGGSFYPAGVTVPAYTGDRVVVEMVADPVAGTVDYRYKINGSDWVDAGQTTTANTGTWLAGGDEIGGNQNINLISFKTEQGGSTNVEFLASEADASGFTSSNGEVYTDTGTPVIVPASTDGFFYGGSDIAGNNLQIDNSDISAQGDDYELEAWIGPQSQLGAFGQYQSASDQNIMVLLLTGATNFCRAYWRASDSTTGSETFSVANVAHDIRATGGWLKITRDKATGTFRCYTKLQEGDSYVEHSDSHVAAAGLAIDTTTSDFYVGAYASSGSNPNPIDRLYRVRQRWAIDSGPWNIDIDASNAGHKSFTDEVGNTVTVNRTTTTGNAPTAWVPPNTGWSIHDDTDDYLQFTDASFERAANGEFTLATWYVVPELTSFPVVSTLDNTPNEGEWYLQEVGDNVTATIKSGADASSAAASEPTNNTAGEFIVAAVTQLTDGTIELSTYRDGVLLSRNTAAGDADATSFSNGGPTAIGEAASAQIGGAAANYDTALTDAQLDLIATYLNDTYNPDQV